MKGHADDGGLAARAGWHYNLPGYLLIEIAIYPGIVRLAARNLQAHNTSHREAS